MRFRAKVSFFPIRLATVYELRALFESALGRCIWLKVKSSPPPLTYRLWAIPPLWLRGEVVLLGEAKASWKRSLRLPVGEVAGFVL